MRRILELIAEDVFEDVGHDRGGAWGRGRGLNQTQFAESVF